MLYISRYDASLNYKSTIELSNPYSLFSTVTCDNDGFYYVVWAQPDKKEENFIDRFL